LIVRVALTCGQVLELGNTTRTAERLDRDELSNTQVTDSTGRAQEMLIEPRRPSSMGLVRGLDLDAAGPLARAWRGLSF
jgi:hypothetical protein